MSESPETILRRHIRNALAQMRREIPPMHLRTAADIQAAEDRCVETLVQVVTDAAAPPQPHQRDPASTTGGSATLAATPRTRHMDRPPPPAPAPGPGPRGFGFTRDVTA